MREKQNDLERAYVDVGHDQRGSFFARSYVDGHIRATVARLREAYIQLYQVEDDSPDREWLQEIVDSLEQFATSFPARSRVLPLGAAATSLKSFVEFPAILWLVGFTGLGSWIVAKAGTCVCHVIYVSTSIAVIWIALSMISAFRKKRAAFLKADVYRRETELLGLIGGEPYVELQMDVLGLALMALVFLTAAVFDHFLGLDHQEDLYLVFGLASFLACVSVGVASTRREWAWGRQEIGAT